MTENEQLGTVYLVGAGPGDPELLTLKGARLLSEADAVVYDALVSSEIMERVSHDAARHFVGKREGKHFVPQDQTNELLYTLARHHSKVVRLKGGDPYLFGRGAEEEAYLAERGVCVEVVPGITSALAVPAYAGIPLTHRDYASAVVIATGHLRKECKEDCLDWEQLGALPATISVLMGVKNLSEIVSGLLRGGRAPQTPAAIVQWGTTERQRELVATLETIVDEVAKEGLGAPSVLIVGDVIRHRNVCACPDES